MFQEYLVNPLHDAFWGGGSGSLVALWCLTNWIQLAFITFEGTTNLLDWTAIATNRIDSTLLSFSDSGEGAQARFYRARLR